MTEDQEHTDLCERLEAELANQAFCGAPGVYRGLAWGVLNDAGAVDLVVTEVAGRARLYRNVAPGRGHWLLVRAVDPAQATDDTGQAAPPTQLRAPGAATIARKVGKIDGR